MQKVWRRGSTVSTIAPEAPALPSTADKATETVTPPALDRGTDPDTPSGVDKGTGTVTPSSSDKGTETVTPVGSDKATETVGPSVSDGGVQTEIIEEEPEVFQVQVGDELVMEQPLGPGFDEKIIIKVADVLDIDKLAEASNAPDQDDKADDKKDDKGSIESEHMQPEHQVLLEELTRETKRLEEMRRQLQVFVEKHGIDIRLLDHWEKYSSQSTELKQLRPRCLLPSEALRERHELMKESLLKVEEGRAAVRHRCIEALEKITRELQGIPVIETPPAGVEIPDDKVILDHEEEASPSQAKSTTDIKEMSTLKRLLTRISSMISNLTTPRSQSLFDNAVWYAKLAVRNLSLGYLWQLTRWPTNVVCQPFLRCGGWLFEPQRWATLADRSEQRLSTIYRILVSACAWEAIFWAANASRRQESEAADGTDGAATPLVRAEAEGGDAAAAAGESEEGEMELWKKKKEEEITHWLLCEDLERARGALKELEGAREAEDAGWELVGLEGLESLARAVHGEPVREPVKPAAAEAE
ncbi:uncharacterized protein K452DRAFT_288148 [Aplosporella prunicola CBS 121167]|uniref:Uncharacterized protein n=1 Tax=Aplosporella prunicola CBS 121167 TaxID=1176127 RepID=A0A6A6BCZ2_9PEZI|nr:uncharacterized protein K452DRAFT_288148 [Aplosporella prunicola CBS 121167]KAF2141448.1 hypothetical protein K452DRAFT_288148 [Aplosporella prunicola CBS 121167]